MVSIFVVVAVVAFVGWMAWRRWSDSRMPTGPLPAAGIPPETLAFEAFTHGNSYLAEGKFAEATAAFQRSRELDPKRPHVAERLAEVARRQHVASQSLPGAS
jgi:predicted negative regulator of RcsB-dependent stress response